MADSQAVVQGIGRVRHALEQALKVTSSWSVWVRHLMAFGFGAVSALGFAPFHAWFLIFVSLPAFAWLLERAEQERRGFVHAGLAAWCFGLGIFLVGMHWIAYPFMVDTERHGWMMPFAVLLFAGGLSLFFVFPAILFRWLGGHGWPRVLTLAALLASFEWLRGTIFTGLPWNLWAYVWAGDSWMAQWAAFIGAYGVSLFTIAMATLPVALVDRGRTRIARLWPPLLALAIACSMSLAGWLRVPSDVMSASDDITVRLVQPNVPQHEKWDRSLLVRNWQSLTNLTSQPGLKDVALVVWPEAAPPFEMLNTDGALDVLGKLLPDHTALVSGTRRFETSGEGDARVFQFYNSSAVIDGRGQVLAIYDKSHLVPFGEYLPFYEWLSPLGLTQLTGGSRGFFEGGGVKTLRTAELPPFGVLICYEIIFPGEVVEIAARPKFLINLTDDSWFGPWVGPYQHLEIAQFRAIEEGLPILRSANTGVSAIIDSYGRVISSLSLNTIGVLDAKIPPALAPTLYSYAGNASFLALLLIFLGVGLFFSRSTP